MKEWICKKSERKLLKKIVSDIILGKLWDRKINLYEDYKNYNIYKLIKFIYDKVQRIKGTPGIIYDENDDQNDIIEPLSMIVTTFLDEDPLDFLGAHYCIHLTQTYDESDIHIDNGALLKYAGPKYIDHDEYFEFGEKQYLNFILWCLNKNPNNISL